MERPVDGPIIRERISIDKRWYFHLGDEPRAVSPRLDHGRWRVLNVPHDWSIEGTPRPDNPAGAGGGFFPGGIGWYRREIEIPTDLGEKEVLIEFDGVYMNSEVYCNGKFCGRRPYGYSSFCYNLTPFVDAGEPAIISVRVDNSRHKNSRWYTGSGIYRHVWLTIASPVRVDHWGVFVTTPEANAAQARVQFTTTVINNRNEACDLELSSSLFSPDGTRVAFAESGDSITGRGKLAVENSMVVDQPELWSPENPRLYTLQTSITSGGDVLDVHKTTCGIRTIGFDANNGFFLNGENLKFRGVNEHHDAGCLGAAVPDDVLRRRFTILKEMGCNAIRIAHNPASPTFLDLCDEMGFMVVEDAFDEWKDGKTDFGYQDYWETWWERDLADMIRRDRNHPSIVMWSVGNEIKEVREGAPEGLPMMAALREICHTTDPTRPMTCGCNAIRKTNAGGYGPLMDVVGYNGGGGSCFDYEKDHAAYPDRVMFASEVPHSLQTRGVYRTRTWYRDLADDPHIERLDVPHLTEDEVFTGFDEHYQSSYDNAMVRISSIDSWRLTSTLPFLCGEFRWSGFDYLGECHGWPAKSWNYGVIDLCGFPKDTFYFYMSQWAKQPMVHVLPHWSWSGLEGTIIPVVVYSNCERVELFLDEISFGTQQVGGEMSLQWNVEYRPGTIRAVGFLGDQPAADCHQTTAGEAAALTLRCDEPSIRADGTGIAHITVCVVDDRGVLVPAAIPELAFEVTGAGALIGLENGDPIDTANYKSSRRKAFHGMALAVVQAAEHAGAIHVRVAAEGLSPASIRVETK